MASLEQFSALGTSAVVSVCEPSQLDAALAAVRGTVEAFDRACSRFREDSELTALNRAGGQPVRVSRLLLEAVRQAVRAAALTGGDVDPTVGDALIALGYDRDFDDIRRSGSRSPRIVAVPGWRVIEIDSDQSTIRIPSQVRLDLGATAKALAADYAVQAAHRVAGGGVLVSLGGDIAVAGEAPAEGWRVRVTDDHRAGAEAPGQWITLRGGGLASSSTTARTWAAAGTTMHHLVDPGSGLPASGPWRTVTVAAASCLDANVASTAAIIRGTAAVEWLGEQRLPSRLVAEPGRAVHVAGWPGEGDDLA